MQCTNYLSKLKEFLTSPLPQSLLSIHPNETTRENFDIPLDWEDWWTWAQAAEDTTPWRCLLSYYLTGSPANFDIPMSLRTMIDDIRTLQLAREQGSPVVPSFVPCSRPSIFCHKNGIPSSGMSPKKSHEVSSMSTYIAELLCSSDKMRHVKYVVDVGAGQGYLSRALQESGLHVLALDSSQVQAQGAERRRIRNLRDDLHSGSLTYKTVNITPSTLVASIDEWVNTLIDGTVPTAPVSIMVVALHACGSLTPDILRASFSMLEPRRQINWNLASMVVVGCCYNLMEPQDFPLACQSSPAIHLTSSHLQLSSQVPLMWLHSSSDNSSVSNKAVESVKKVAWRAMLEGLLSDAGTGESLNRCPGTTRRARLGRLNDKVYDSWPTFLAYASKRLQVPLHITYTDDQRQLIERRLSVLHVLRCLLGPCVESLIVWDRFVWAIEVVRSIDPSMEIELINIFDQRQGSGRNIAIVLKPQ